MGEPETIIRVSALSKRYVISHNEDRGRYTTLRDTLSKGMKLLTNRMLGRCKVDPTREEFWALRDVSFEVKRGEVVGIIGRNGAGKSTLLKILSRITEPTCGRIEIDGRVASLLEVGTGFHPELTGRENIFLNGAILGMSRVEIKRKFDEIVAFAEIERFLDTPVKRYSSGMYMRLAFAIAAHLQPDILIVDEVLAVGDTTFQKKCLGRMEQVAQEGRTVLFVSHNMAAVKALCTRATLLEHGKVVQEGAVGVVAASYLGTAQVSTVTFSNKPLKHFTIRQVGTAIEVDAEFEMDRQLPMVALGFVVSDDLGNPIFGCNPVICGVENFGKSTRKGIIRARVSQPKLMDGSYKVSIWFADGMECFLSEPNVATLEIQGMTERKQLPISIVGCVVADCQWEIEGTS